MNVTMIVSFDTSRAVTVVTPDVTKRDNDRDGPMTAAERKRRERERRRLAGEP